MSKLFGTDGIRGVANIYPMTPEMMLKVGLTLGAHIPDHSRGIVIGRDSRRSGAMLEAALTAGLLASGINVFTAGVIPTPAVAYLTRNHDAAAGIVISASHNPAQDNGIKIFGHDGFKLSDARAESIETALLAGASVEERPIADGIGTRTILQQAGQHYVDAVIHSIFGPTVPDFRHLKMAVDCANGAASFVAPLAFERLNAAPTLIAAEPDGLNINQACGALHVESLQECVLREQAAIGIAFDGDADRLILVDEQGQKVDGDQILAMLALNLAAQQKLAHKTLVTTIMSNINLDMTLQAAGITTVRTRVGDRHVVQKMRELDANLGGENSGHLVLLDHGTTGDGLAAALSVLQLMQSSGKSLSELAEQLILFPQCLLNVPIKARTPLEELPGVLQAVRSAEQQLGDRGRVLVRYSGTELLARVMVEGESEELVTQLAETIAAEF